MQMILRKTAFASALVSLAVLPAGCGIFGGGDDTPRGVLSYDVPEEVEESRPEVKEIAKQTGRLPADTENARYTDEVLKAEED